MTILIFFVVLFVLILVHEWGHFIVAKKTGMRVDEFGIGFPPKLFSIKKGETEYSFNLLPIGGFVRIFGENAQDSATVALQGGDVSRSFTSKSKWAQTAVLLAGVTMNTIFAWFLFVIVFLVGVPTSVEESTASLNAELTVTHVVEGSPAAEAGIPIGAVIQSYDTTQETEVLSPTAFRDFAGQSDQTPIQVTYEANGEVKTVDVLPVTGFITENADQKAIGVALSLVETVSKPIHLAVYEATITTGKMLFAIAQGLLALLIDIARFDADFSSIAGPIGIVGLVGDAAEFGIASLLMFTAMISLNLAVINLLPIPALDGGRLLFVAIEAVVRRPINPVWVVRLNMFGFVLLMGLMVAVTYSDILKKF